MISGRGLPSFPLLKILVSYELLRRQRSLLRVNLFSFLLLRGIVE